MSLVPKDDFEALCQNGYIGFYNKCEVIEIFGYDKTKETPFNIFSLIIFEDSLNVARSPKLLTDKLQCFNSTKDIKWGIKKRDISIQEAKLFFEGLAKFNIFKIDDKPLLIGSLNVLKRQYIQRNDGVTTVQINNVLKNNFHTGSYIIECFDMEKENLKFLIDNPIFLNEFSEQVSEILPLRIANVSDRLGNVIFQFPISVFKLSQKPTSKQFDGFSITIQPNLKMKRTLNLQLIAETYYDNVILDFAIKDIKSPCCIVNISTESTVSYHIFDKDHNLLLYKESFNTLKYMECNMHLIEHQNRVFFIDGDKREIQVYFLNKFNVGSESKKDSTAWIITRKYDQELGLH